jgi:hypothetical protein
MYQVKKVKNNKKCAERITTTSENCYILTENQTQVKNILKTNRNNPTR